MMENGWTERIEELEAENKRLGGKAAAYDNWIDAINKYEAWKDENKRLREALQAIATGDRSAHEAMLWAREAMREASHDDHAK